MVKGEPGQYYFPAILQMDILVNYVLSVYNIKSDKTYTVANAVSPINTVAIV